MTGVPRAALHGAVAARLAAYPERTLERKHVHFLFYERALRWVYEGEDRNRCFLWHATPFYAPAVFAAAARAPDELKADDRLRRAVLRRVAPEVADVENAGTGAAVAAPGATWRRRARVAGTSLLFRTVGEPTERRLRRWLSPADGHGDESAVLRLIRAQLRRGGPVSDYLHPAAVESVLTQARDYEREQFSVVLTMTSVIDALQEGEPALGGFRDVPMT
jgi:asparagine synthase (glutamine-hydrolysing)